MTTESLSSYRVLPPIVLFEKDRCFLAELDNFVDAGLDDVGDHGSAEERYLIFRAAFDKVIEYVRAYRPLLTAIKGEYERLIASVRQGHKDAAFLRAQIETLACQPTTIANYRRRCEELETEVERLKLMNERLEMRSQDLREAIKTKQAEHEAVQHPTPKIVRRDRRLLPGFSIAEMTDVATLGRTLADLDTQIRELQLSRKTKFLPKEHQRRLRKSLQEKLERRETAVEGAKTQAERANRMRAAVEAARAYNKILPLHQSLATAVLRAVRRQKGREGQSKSVQLDEMRRTSKPNLGTTSYVDEDPSREQESEMIFEYLEKFNELVEEGRLNDAVLHAANSPRGILCSLDVLLRFEQLEQERQQPGLLFDFCEALLAVAPAAKLKPNADVSFRCLQCALECERHDLVPHWVQRLTLSLPIAELLSTSAASLPTERGRTLFYDLSAFVFDQLGATDKSLDSYVAAGRFDTALEFASHKGQLDTGGLLNLLERHPHRQLALGLLRRSLAPLPDVCRVLLAAGQPHQVGAVVDEMIDDEVRRCPETPPSAIAERVMMLSGVETDAWRTIIRVSQSLVHLYDMLAVSMVSDILESSLSILTDLE